MSDRLDGLRHRLHLALILRGGAAGLVAGSIVAAIAVGGGRLVGSELPSGTWLLLPMLAAAIGGAARLVTPPTVSETAMLLDRIEGGHDRHATGRVLLSRGMLRPMEVLALRSLGNGDTPSGIRLRWPLPVRMAPAAVLLAISTALLPAAEPRPEPTGRNTAGARRMVLAVGETLRDLGLDTEAEHLAAIDPERMSPEDREALRRMLDRLGTAAAATDEERSALERSRILIELLLERRPEPDGTAPENGTEPAAGGTGTPGAGEGETIEEPPGGGEPVRGDPGATRPGGEPWIPPQHRELVRRYFERETNENE